MRLSVAASGVCNNVLGDDFDRADSTNESPPVSLKLVGERVGLGDETNGLRAGMEWGIAPNLLEMSVYIMTSMTNEGWNFISPPTNVLTRCELRDTNGTLAPQVPGALLARPLPATLRSQDVPHSGKFARDLLMLNSWSPMPLFQRPIQLLRGPRLLQD